MLQIISGKFFDSDDRFCYEAKGILFSNYSWMRPIETCVATLEPVDTYTASVSSYVISYVNQIEKAKPPAKDVLVRVGDPEIIEQFKLLCSFSLRAFFHQDKSVVAVACREHMINSSNYHIPSNFIPRNFSRQIRGSANEVESFSEFIDDVIGLRRKQYTSLMASLRSFYDALQIIGNNIDLAYSLLVYSLEALAQRTDTYVPTWEDYPIEVKRNLDKILCDLSDDIANDIRNVLLKDSNLKAQKRFLDFVHSHINEQFFIDEAPPGFRAIRNSEFDRALRNVYRIRSKFVHELQPIQHQLKYPDLANGDVFHFLDEPYLTLSGLARVVHHVIRNFIRGKEKVSHETFNWRSELPGKVEVEWDPKHWVGRHKALKLEHVPKKLSGFLSQLESAIVYSKPITDLREVLSEYEKLLDQSPSPYKIQMLVTYVLYHLFVADDNVCINYQKVFDKYRKLLDCCSIETLVIWLFNEQRWPWKAEECASCWQGYEQTKYNKSSVTIPPVMGVAIIVEIASTYKEENNIAEYNSWMKKAILEATGQKEIQKKLIEARSGLVQVKGSDLIHKHAAEAS